MSKTFTQAPKPKPLTADIISAFERNGMGQDTQTHKPTNVEKYKTTPKGKKEPTQRLSIDLPQSLHTRFKMACAQHHKKMLAEVTDFIARRTKELEKT